MAPRRRTARASLGAVTRFFKVTRIREAKMAELTHEAPARTLARLDEAGRATLFTDARTANSFAPTSVTDEELADVWSLAKWPPTAANVQPLRVLYVRPGEGRDRLLAPMADRNKDKDARR